MDTAILIIVLIVLAWLIGEIFMGAGATHARGGYRYEGEPKNPVPPSKRPKIKGGS